MSADSTLTPSHLRGFGLLTGGIVAALFGLLLPWLFDYAWPTWPWILAALLAGLGLLFPPALGPVYRVWMKFGHVMGFINSRLILGLMYYLMITPIGAIMRLFGWDPMRRRLGVGTSYRVPSRDRPIKHMERPY